MTAFIGFLGNAADAHVRVQARANYLFAPALHLSLSGRFALAFASGTLLSDFSFSPPNLSVAVHTPFGNGVPTVQNLITLYYRYGRHLRAHIPVPLSFALYDAGRSLAILGATGGRRCYIEEGREGLWFSSDPTLLRSPCAVELAILRDKK